MYNSYMLHKLSKIISKMLSDRILSNHAWLNFERKLFVYSNHLAKGRPAISLSLSLGDGTERNNYCIDLTLYLLQSGPYKLSIYILYPLWVIQHSL